VTPDVEHQYNLPEGYRYEYGGAVWSARMTRAK